MLRFIKIQEEDSVAYLPIFLKNCSDQIPDLECFCFVTRGYVKVSSLILVYIFKYSLEPHSFVSTDFKLL